MYKHNRRQQERLQRALEERRSRGEDEDKAFDDLGLEAPDEESGAADEQHEEQEPFAESLEAGPNDAGSGEVEDAPFATAEEERHPLLRSALNVLKHLHTVFRDADPALASSLNTLFQGAGDAMGGLAQGLSGRAEEDDPDEYGLRVTQLKRALRGAAFTRGALFPLRSAVTSEQFGELRRMLRQLEQDIFQELSRLRSEHRADDSE